MNEEKIFNDPGNVEPAKIQLNGSQDVQEEQLDQSTLNVIPDKQEPDTANQSPTPGNIPVQASPQDSEMYKNLQAAFTKSSQENSDLRGRLAQMETRLASMPTTQQPAAPITPPNHNFDDLDKTAGEFEELNPMTEHIKRMQGEIDNQNKVIDTQQNNMNQQQADRNQEIHLKKIEAVHPDAFQIAQSIDFQGWLARQPAYMQDWLNTGSAPQIIDLLSSYKGKGQQAPAPTPEQIALESARLAGANVPTEQVPTLTTDSNKRIYTNDEIGRMSFSEYAALSEDIDLALAEGRVTL